MCIRDRSREVQRNKHFRDNKKPMERIYKIISEKGTDRYRRTTKGRGKKRIFRIGL